MNSTNNIQVIILEYVIHQNTCPTFSFDKKKQFSSHILYRDSIVFYGAKEFPLVFNAIV